MRRSTIVNKIRKNLEKIKALKAENIELNRQQLLMSDKQQWYKESEETIGRGKNKETAIIGRVYWIEKIEDEDSGEILNLERNVAIRKNNEWL